MNDIHWNKKGKKKEASSCFTDLQMTKKKKKKPTMAYFRLTEKMSGCMAFTEQTL